MSLTHIHPKLIYMWICDPIFWKWQIVFLFDFLKVYFVGDKNTTAHAVPLNQVLFLPNPRIKLKWSLLSFYQCSQIEQIRKIILIKSQSFTLFFSLPMILQLAYSAPACLNDFFCLLDDPKLILFFFFTISFLNWSGHSYLFFSFWVFVSA